MTHLCLLFSRHLKLFSMIDAVWRPESILSSSNNIDSCSVDLSSVISNQLTSFSSSLNYILVLYKWYSVFQNVNLFKAKPIAFSLNVTLVRLLKRSECIK